jgi:hypothetical protein
MFKNVKHPLFQQALRTNICIFISDKTNHAQSTGGSIVVQQNASQLSTECPHKLVIPGDLNYICIDMYCQLPGVTIMSFHRANYGLKFKIWGFKSGRNGPKSISEIRILGLSNNIKTVSIG